MDILLIAIASMSLGLAVVLSVVVWRMAREERRRREARAAALAAMAGVAQSGPDSRDPALDLPLNMDPANATRQAAAVAAGPLFTPPPRRSAWGARLAIMAAIALSVTTAVLLSLSLRGARDTATTAAPGAPAIAPANAPAGLELLSLADSRDAEHLTITGIVRNPRGGTPLNRVTVMAFTFDGSGAFLASARTLIDVTALAPGDESPFVVTLPASDRIARYRVGFRTEDGRVIAHVDKRHAVPVAEETRTAAAERGAS